MLQAELAYLMNRTREKAADIEHEDQECRALGIERLPLTIPFRLMLS
jgi:hypothetical protein